MTLAACSSGNGKSSLISGAETTTVDVDGQSYEVNKDIVARYTDTQISAALRRNAAAQARPTDASSFGAKKAEVKWRAFDYDIRKADFISEVGVVTVVHYEHGLEIIKDGTSWFYDGYQYEKVNIMNVAAAPAILDSPRWEPVDIRFNVSSWILEYTYPEGHAGTGSETISLNSFDLKKVNVNGIGDMLSYPDAIKEY